MATGYSGTADISGYFNAILEDAMFVLREDSLMPQLVTLYGDSSGWEALFSPSRALSAISTSALESVSV